MRITRWQQLAAWLLGSARGALVLWWIERAALVLGALVSGWMLYQAEHYLLPVIRDWRIESVERVGDAWVVQGVMFKSRPCELVATSVMAVPKQPLAPRRLVYQIKPNEILGGHAPVGYTTWGPWEMRIPKELLMHRDQVSFLEVVGHHRCHALWTQDTLYGTVRMEELP